MAFTLRTFLLILLAVAASLLHEGSTEQVSQRPTVKVPLRGTAILPLNLDTTLSVTDVKVEWYHEQAYVHVFHNNQPYLKYQDKAFKNRTFLFEDQISEGNVSLKLINVTEQDAGKYTCNILGVGKPKTFEFYLYVVDVGPSQDLVWGRKPDPTPTPEPNQDLTWKIAVCLVAGVVVVGVMAGVFYKSRGNKFHPVKSEGIAATEDSSLSTPENTLDPRLSTGPKTPIRGKKQGDSVEMQTLNDHTNDKPDDQNKETSPATEM